MERYNLIGTIIVIIFILLAPESPYYLITTGKQKEGIAVLNYIAWFNGSNNRISESAQFDLLGEIIKQNNTLNQTLNGKL